MQGRVYYVCFIYLCIGYDPVTSEKNVSQIMLPPLLFVKKASLFLRQLTCSGIICNLNDIFLKKYYVSTVVNVSV